MVGVKQLRAITAVAVSLALVGCGGSSARVEGTISYDGKPVEEGAITFVPSDGKAQKVSTRFFQGRYAIDGTHGLTPGKYKVELNALVRTGKKITTGDGPPIDEVKDILPAKYNSATTLSADLTGGANTKNFELPK